MDQRDIKAEIRREEEDRSLARLRRVGGVERLLPRRPMGFVVYGCGHLGFWFTDVSVPEACVMCGQEVEDG